MIGQPGDSIAYINWISNPFRAEKFAAIWTPASEAVLDYGATGWALLRSGNDPQQFMQLALFPNKLDFERYWLSPEIAEYRVQAQGLFQVPVLPEWYTVEGNGSVIGALLES